jgi:ornithine carbamoyltransferase
MLDALAARSAESELEVRDFAAQHRMAVINAMRRDERPTQALSDLTALLQRRGGLDGLRLLYVGGYGPGSPEPCSGAGDREAPWSGDH